MVEMVRANCLAVFGLALCLISIPLAWIWIFLSTASFGSGDTPLDEQVRTFVAWLCGVYFLGLAISLRFTLGGLLLIISNVIVGVVAFWHNNGDTDSWFGMVAAGFAIGVLGSALVFASIFIQITRSGSELDGRRDRFTTWTLRRADSVGPSTKPWMSFSIRVVNLPSIKTTLTVSTCILIVITLAFAAMLTQPVSKLSTTMVFDSGYYGESLCVAFYVDGELVDQTTLHVPYFDWNVERGVSAGSHTLSVDLASGDSTSLDGIPDSTRAFKVLPFTTEYHTLAFHVGLI